MSKRNPFLALTVAGFLLSVAFGCSSQGILATMAGGGSQSGWVGTGPHTANWKQVHGSQVLSVGGVANATIGNGLACSSCHTTARAADGSVPKSPSANYTCFSCHNGPTGGGVGNPHSPNWRRVHGQTVEAAGGVAKAAIASGQTCATCHTTAKAADGSLPKSPVAQSTCFTCHNGPAGGED